MVLDADPSPASSACSRTRSTSPTAQATCWRRACTCPGSTSTGSSRPRRRAAGGVAAPDPARAGGLPADRPPTTRCFALRSMRDTPRTRRSPGHSRVRTGRPPSRWRRRPRRFRIDAPSEVHFNPPGGLRVSRREEGESMDLLHGWSSTTSGWSARWSTVRRRLPDDAAGRAGRDLCRRHRRRSDAALAAGPSGRSAGDVGRGDSRPAVRLRRRAERDGRRPALEARAGRARRSSSTCARSSMRGGSTRRSSTRSASRRRSSPTVG